MKYLGLLLFFNCNVFIFKIIAQELPVNNKKIYVAPDHKIYFNKSQPAYIFISTSPDPKSRQIRLKSTTSPQYTNPMYFTDDGRHILYSPYAVDTATKKIVLPKIDIQFHFYVDGQPPVTKILYDKKSEYISKGIHYIAGPTAVSFESTDALSGVEKTYFSIDGSDFVPFKNSIVLDKEKEYSLKYYSVDNTGNAEQIKDIIFYIDNTPPVSKLQITGEQYEDILSGNTRISITSTDNMSGTKSIYMSVDDSIFRLYSNIINTSALSEGDHTLFYYAVDEVKNAEKVNKYDFYVDKTPPQVIEEVIGKTFMANGKEYSAGTSKLKITSFDNKAGVKEIYYSINSAPYVKYDKPILLSGYKGTLIVNSYAIDNVGNKSQNDLSNSKKNNISYIRFKWTLGWTFIHRTKFYEP